MSGSPTTHAHCCCGGKRRTRKIEVFSFSFKLFGATETDGGSHCNSHANCAGCTHVCNGVDRDAVQQMIDTAVARSEERANLQILGVTGRLDAQLLRIDDLTNGQRSLERRVTTLEAKQNSPGNIEISEGRRNMPFRFAIVGGLLGLLLTIVGGLSVPESIFQMIHGGTWVATKSLFWWLIYGLPLIGSGLVGGTALGVALMFRRGGKS